MEIKKTSLNKLHQDNKAKFVEFAGYEMPIQYSKGIVEEHKFTRSNAGIFDVSHMGQLFIYGDDNLTNDLEKIFPLDLKNLKQNCSKYSFLMNDNAGIYDDLIITKIEKGYLIILNAACKDNDFKILSNLLKDKYEMVLDDQRSLIAIQGPKSVEILNKIIDGVEKLSFMTGNWFDYKDTKVFATRSGYTGEDGFEVSINIDYANWDKGRVEQDIEIQMFDPQDMDSDPIMTYSVQRAKLLSENITSQTGEETVLNVSFEGYERDKLMNEPWFLNHSNLEPSNDQDISEGTEAKIERVET